jgi:hypothetical protein
VNFETLAGGTVTGMLVAVMAIFMRRTKDVDERRDEALRIVIEAAKASEERAITDRERAYLDKEAAITEVIRLRAELAQLQLLHAETLRQLNRNV